MIARPETAACAGRPRCAWPDASAAAAPPTQKISTNAAIASAAARRWSAGRSGKDRLQRHADDLKPPRQAAESVLAQVFLRYAERGRRLPVLGQLQRFRDVRQQLAQRGFDRLGLLRTLADRFA